MRTDVRENYWRVNFVCPYLEAADRTALRCEGGCLLRFETGDEAREYIARYCASFGYRTCSIAMAKNRHYEAE